MLGLGLSIPRCAVRAGDALTREIAALFSAGEQGVWYDPSDFSTMFQDAAGTIPVTAVGQPVGRILDKSGRGNHATQTTAASRPILSARYNLLTKTEQFNDSAWQKIFATISNNSTTAPDGTLTADTFILQSGITFTAAASAFVNSTSLIVQGITVAATAIIYRLRVKGAGYDMVTLRVSESATLSGTNQAVTRVLLSNGQVISVANTGNLTGVSSTCTRTSDGWCDITLQFTSGAAQTLYFGLWAWNSTAITSDGIKGLYLWGADVRVANESVNIPPYQRVNTATDYGTEGFPFYLLFDGIDDALQTASVNFTGTDKMTVWAGVRKLSDSSFNMIVELSTSVGTINPGSFYFGSLTSGRYEVATRGTAGVFLPTANNSFVAPITNVITSLFVISTDTCNFRANGALITSSSSDQGTGNYGNYPLYIGSRGGTTLPFNGRLYSLIVRGAQSTDTQISNAETYVNSKTGAY